MLREKTITEINEFCQNHNIKNINIRTFTKNGKSRIKITFLCKECGRRFDVSKDTLFRQEYPGLCTSCAHKKSASYKRLSAQNVVDFIENHGYTVLTPINEIKPRGKNHTFNLSKIKVKNKYGDVFTIIYNNFRNNIEYYNNLNSDGYSVGDNRIPSSLEKKVAFVLEDIGIPYKREFKFTDCKGDYKTLSFDFCLFYTEKENRLLIEIDDEFHHISSKPDFDKRKKYDKIKDYYCIKHNIPLLRIPYFDFDEKNTYKQKIIEFINTHRSNDSM